MEGRLRGPVEVEVEQAQAFDAFVERHEARLRRALVAAYGPEDGRDAAANALAYAWEHFDRVQGMASPVGYLYRVGQSSRRTRKQPVLFPEPPAELTIGEPRLPVALAALSERQRVCVVLVHGYSWTHEEVGDLLDIGVSSVRNHLARGLANLRADLGEVWSDA